MPAHQIDKIFEPYYSESGNGKGLGLAVVYGIIECHEGLIRCESKYGKGTSFQLLIPVSDVIEDEGISGVSLEMQVDLPAAYVGKRILIIDDEQSVIELCQELLHQFGLVSLAVRVRGENAVDEILLALNEEHFDGILIDVVMPELNGTQILDILKEKQIDVPVIIMSGFSPERLDFYHRRFNVKAIMPKPFGMAEMAMAIQRAMPIATRSELANRSALEPPHFYGRRSEREDIN